MRLTASNHEEQPWLIHEIAPDFDLHDAWALDTPGTREDFARLVDLVPKVLVGDGLIETIACSLRWQLGKVFGWDRREQGLGGRVTSIDSRVPEGLTAPEGAWSSMDEVTPLFQTDTEFAAEIANGTVHGIIHLGWVPRGDGRWRGQFAVLVKPAGRLGRAYLAGIEPFRERLIYPALMRRISEAWNTPVTAWLGVREVPQWALDASPGAAPDYADAFSLPTTVSASAEEWARAMFGDSADATKRFIWVGLCGLRIGSAVGRETVAGWAIETRSRDLVCLVAESPGLHATLMIRVAGGTVTLATLVRYRNRMRGVLWERLSAVHRRLAPGIVRETEQSLRLREHAATIV